MKKVLKLISRAFWAKNKQFGALNSISRLKSSAIHYLMIKSPGETTFAYVLVRFFGWANSKRHSRKYFSGHNLQHLMDDSFFFKGNVLKKPYTGKTSLHCKRFEVKFTLSCCLIE